MKTFPDILKRSMTDAGFSIDQLARKLSVSTTCINKWRRGDTEPKLKHAAALCDVLGKTIQQLAGR